MSERVYIDELSIDEALLGMQQAMMVGLLAVLRRENKEAVCSFHFRDKHAASSLLRSLEDTKPQFDIVDVSLALEFDPDPTIVITQRRLPERP